MASQDRNFRNESQYDRAPEFNQEDGVVTEAPDIGTLAVLNKSEIDQQVTTAKRFPRSIVKFRNEALQLATLDEQTAAECIYALPRDGKTIEGPSARFAEIINYAWGNTRAGARTISEEGEFVKSQGLFYDLEKNTAISYEVSRRIIDKNGKRYKADMIGTTSNAACSIALRNAVLKGIPKALWSPIYKAARSVVAGDVRTLANRREEALKSFVIFGITPEMIYATLQIKGKEDITIDHMVVLRGILTAIQEGDTTPEQAFSSRSAEASESARVGTEQRMDAIKAQYAKQQSPVNPPEAASQENLHESSPQEQVNPFGQESTKETAGRMVENISRRRSRHNASEPSGSGEAGNE
jgi:hypothetical protein